MRVNAIKGDKSKNYYKKEYVGKYIDFDGALFYLDVANNGVYCLAHIDTMLDEVDEWNVIPDPNTVSYNSENYDIKINEVVSDLSNVIEDQRIRIQSRFDGRIIPSYSQLHTVNHGEGILAQMEYRHNYESFDWDAFTNHLREL